MSREPNAGSDVAWRWKPRWTLRWTPLWISLRRQIPPLLMMTLLMLSGTLAMAWLSATGFRMNSNQSPDDWSGKIILAFVWIILGPGTLMAFLMAVALGDWSDGWSGCRMSGWSWLRRQSIPATRIALPMIVAKTVWVAFIYAFIWWSLRLAGANPSLGIPIILGSAAAIAAHALVLRSSVNYWIDATILLTSLALGVAAIWVTVFLNSGQIGTRQVLSPNPPLAMVVSLAIYVIACVLLIHEITAVGMDEPRFAGLVNRFAAGRLSLGRFTRVKHDRITSGRVGEEAAHDPASLSTSLDSISFPRRGVVDRSGGMPSPKPISALIGYEWRRCRRSILTALIVAMIPMLAWLCLMVPVTVLPMVFGSIVSLVAGAMSLSMAGTDQRGSATGTPMLLRMMPAPPSIIGYTRLSFSFAVMLGFLSLMMIPVLVWVFGEASGNVARAAESVGGYRPLFGIVSVSVVVVLGRLASASLVASSNRHWIGIPFVLVEGALAMGVFSYALRRILVLLRPTSGAVADDPYDRVFDQWMSWLPGIETALIVCVIVKFLVAIAISIWSIRRGLHRVTSLSAAVSAWVVVVALAAAASRDVTVYAGITTALWASALVACIPLGRWLAVPWFASLDRHR